MLRSTCKKFAVIFLKLFPLGEVLPFQFKVRSFTLAVEYDPQTLRGSLDSSLKKHDKTSIDSPFVFDVTKIFLTILIHAH